MICKNGTPYRNSVKSESLLPIFWKCYKITTGIFTLFPYNHALWMHSFICTYFTALFYLWFSLHPSQLASFFLKPQESSQSCRSAPQREQYTWHCCFSPCHLYFLGIHLTFIFTVSECPNSLHSNFFIP